MTLVKSTGNKKVNLDFNKEFINTFSEKIQSSDIKFINQTLGYYWIGTENNTTPERTLRNVDNMKKILYLNNEQKLPSWLLYQRAISLFQINQRTESLKYLKYIFKNGDDMVLRLKALIRLMQYSF